MIAGLNVQVFKPVSDDRYSAEKVVSHDKSSIEAKPVSSAQEIIESLRPGTQIVAIDEAQFLPGIATVCYELAKRGLRVIVAVLDANFRGEPFGEAPQLLAIAQKVDKLTAICVVCRREGRVREAEFTQALTKEGEPAPYGRDEVVVGGPEQYEARCLAHHDVPDRPW